MKKIITICLAAMLLFSYKASAQTPNWIWAKSGGGPDAEAFGRTIATDLSGNMYVTGNFGLSGATFGSIALTCAGSTDIFIVKYDASGNVVWAKSAGGTGGDSGNGIVVDSKGNVYITGIISLSGATFGSTTLTSAGGNDIFVAKYDASGNVVWAKSAGGTGADVSYNLVVDKSDNVYVTGYFSAVASFGSIALTSAGSTDMFVAKYDASGNVLWAKSAGGVSSETANAIAIDVSGNIYVTGYFMGTAAVFGTETFVSAGAADVFVAKYDASGNMVWAKSAGGSGTEMGYFLTTDSDGNVYVVGNIGSGGAAFGSVQLTSAGLNDIFIAKYNASGNVVWAKSAGGTGNDYGYGVAAKNNSIYITGLFNAVATFGSLQLTTVGGSDVFVAKYDASGNVVWAKGVGGTGTDDGWGITVDSYGCVYVAGRFGSPNILFGSNTLTNANSATSGTSYDVFIAKLEATTSVAGEQSSIPTEYYLNQNYPNPFNPSTQIEFSIPQSSHVILKVYDLLGKEIAILVNGTREAGTYSTTWNAQNCPSGVYFYRLTSGSYTMTKKLVLMK